MRRHRWLWLTAAAVVVLAGLAYVTLGRYVFARGTSTPVPLAEVQDRYYASTTGGPSATEASVGPSAPARPEHPLPAPGVYVYSTTGGDRIDALAGDHHDYPATTTITVTPTECGVRQRWDVLQERWEEWERCTTRAAAISEPTRVNYDEFFGNGVREDYTCAGAPRPLDAAAGTRWERTCRDADGTADRRVGTVLGTETRRVGAAEVPTLHVRVVVTDDDDRNLQTIDSWYVVGGDLLVAQTSTDHSANASPIGDVNYDEEYAIELTSLEPVTAG